MKTLSFLVFSLLTLGAGSVNATVVTYSFSAVVHQIVEVRPSEHDGITTWEVLLVDSTTMPGHLISLADRASGSFSYNTLAALNSYWQPDPGSAGTDLLYVGGGSADLSFDHTGLIYIANPENSDTLMRVINDASRWNGWDHFSVGTSTVVPGVWSSLNISLVDRTSTAIDGSGIPTILEDRFQFNVPNFPDLNYRMEFNDGRQVHVEMMLDSLTLVPDRTEVPEPASVLLLLAGVATMRLAFHRRPNKSAPA